MNTAAHARAARSGSVGSNQSFDHGRWHSALPVFALVSLPWWLPSPLAAQRPTPTDELPRLELSVDAYMKSVEMVPMRDGVRLYTEIYTPDDAARQNLEAELPIIFLRSPYGVSAGEGRSTRYLASTFRELAKAGYVFAVQDARGRHGSEGDFVWNRPLRDRDDPTAIDASTDAFDSIQWLVDHVPDNNGRVGMLGVSYPGWYVTMALVDPHPALACASPQASPSDYFVNDDFYHNGAFRLSPSAELPYLLEMDRRRNARFPYDQVDTYEFFLELGPLSNLDRDYLKGGSPTWTAFLEHATYDAFWVKGNTLQHLVAVPIPVLNVIGWWDAENLGGALDIYSRLESFDDHDLNRIVVGPWSHGQWAGAGEDGLGAYRFGSDTSGYYQREIEAPWFAHHLQDGADPELPEALMFQTGSNAWKSYDAWPPRDLTEQRALYFRSDGGMSDAVDETAEATPIRFISDPARPVPYTARPVMGFWQGIQNAPGHPERFGRAGKLWKVEDQRFVADRPDVLVFCSEPLESDLEVSGRILARLFTSTTGTDADWVVKLIDVYPERYEAEPWLGGYQLMVADDVVRAKFRHSLTEPEPLVPGEVTAIEVDLRTRNHRFRRGHRVMVQIQSTWFPLIDRNPQTFVNIPDATEADYRLAEHSVWCGGRHASRILLDVVR